jgi:phosphohistidine phosphatase SixA
MILTVWRHGEAGRAARDYERTLTDRGCDDIGFGAQQFHGHCQARRLPDVGLILFSPWIRTRQTADIISGVFAHAQSVQETRIQPGAGPDDACDAVREAQEKGNTEHLLLVSHQPLVSRLIDGLLGDPGRVPPLSSGGLAVLELAVAAPGAAGLDFWSLPPEYGACT